MDAHNDLTLPTHDGDLVDFDELLAAPGMSEAVQDAADRAALRATLITARKAAGLKQRDVAALMETTQSAVSDFERGTTDPHLSTLQRYARAVGARLVVRASVPNGLPAPAGYGGSSPVG